MEEEPLLLNASDLRQYVYCPRVVYYRYCVPVRPPPTFKMDEGKRQHERAEDLEQRRTLRAYGLTDGEREFGVRLASERLGLVGTLDMVVVRRYEVVPVEFKQTEPRAVRPRRGKRRPGPLFASGRGDEAEGEQPVGADLAVALHHKYQLTAYALLAEEHWGRPARRCFVHFLGAKKAAEVAITGGMRNYTRRLMREMRAMIAAQRMPPPTRHAGRCRECEYRRFCNDVD